MYERKIQKEIHCPVERGLDVFCGKWKSRVLCVLFKKGVLRYNEFKEEMVDITDTALASALKSLIKEGLIERKQYEAIPPKVEYYLTERGKSAMPILQAIAEWANGYTKDKSEYNAMPICSLCDFKED